MSQRSHVHDVELEIQDCQRQKVTPYFFYHNFTNLEGTFLIKSKLLIWYVSSLTFSTKKKCTTYSVRLHIYIWNRKSKIFKGKKRRHSLCLSQAETIFLQYVLNLKGTFLIGDKITRDASKVPIPPFKVPIIKSTYDSTQQIVCLKY